MTPPPIQKVIVLGGGSAGLIAALTLKRTFRQLDVRVVRSPEIDNEHPADAEPEGVNEAVRARYRFGLFPPPDENAPTPVPVPAEPAATP